MSLVGTRPPTVDEWDKYELHHRARLATKPGLTGMWQVSGRSNITDFEEVVKLDKQYISEWTIEYFSTQVPTHSKRNYKLYRNLVLIAKRVGTEEYSLKLSSKLKLTKPVRVKEDINLFSEYGEKDIPFFNQRALPSGYNKKEIVNYVRNKGIYPFYKTAGRIQHNKNSNAELHYSSSGFNLMEFDLSKEKLGCIVSGR